MLYYDVLERKSMRLKSYLVETTSMKAPLKELEDDMKDWFGKFKQIMERHGTWNISDDELITILNALTKEVGLEFNIRKRRSYGKYISGAQFGGESVNRGIFFQVDVNPGAAKFFRRFEDKKKQSMFNDINKNGFMRELYKILAHEGVHAEQLLRMTADKDNIKNLNTDNPQDDSSLSYYAMKREIEAYALQAAIDYESLGKSNVYDIYKKYFKDGFDGNPDQKVWKRFLKKFSFYQKEVKQSGLIAALGHWKKNSGKK